MLAFMPLGVAPLWEREIEDGAAERSGLEVELWCPLQSCGLPPPWRGLSPSRFCLC